VNRLKEIRKNKGLSQFNLAKLINVYPQKISEVELGKRDFKLAEAIRAAHVLDVEIEDLVNETL
jgi:DNA-binding XRE family transcriptional regulator